MRARDVLACCRSTSTSTTASHTAVRTKGTHMSAHLHELWMPNPNLNFCAWVSPLGQLLTYLDRHQMDAALLRRPLAALETCRQTGNAAGTAGTPRTCGCARSHCQKGGTGGLSVVSRGQTRKSTQSSVGPKSFHTHTHTHTLSQLRTAQPHTHPQRSTSRGYTASSSKRPLQLNLISHRAGPSQCNRERWEVAGVLWGRPRETERGTKGFPCPTECARVCVCVRVHV
jgi:hypothetical protein